MSAHLCLMAWKLPMGRPNCTRTLAYSTDISSTFCAQPICSAAQAWEELLLARVVTGVEQGVGGQGNRGEVRRAQQGAAHLLQHDGELDVAVARAAVLLRDGQALQAELVAHLLPDRGVVALA